jgi:hypothetical protein
MMIKPAWAAVLYLYYFKMCYYQSISSKEYMEEQTSQVVESPKSRNQLPWALFVIALIAAAGASYYGYTLSRQVSTLKNDKAALQQSIAADTKVEKKETVDFAKPEDAIKAYVGQAEGIKLTKSEGDFASYNYSYGSGTPGGAFIILEKKSGYWFPLFNGQESPSKALGEQLGLPKGWYATDY